MNETALIIGGTGQIGKGVIDAFHNSGYKILCVASTPSIESEKKAFVEYYTYDMSCLGTINDCCDAITKEHNKIDVLVNALGKNVRAPLCNITEEMWDDVMNTNLRSVFFICRAFAKLIEVSGGGAIINIASTAGIRAMPKSPHYIAAKAGVIALTKYFALAFSPLIRVNCVAPGFVLTENHLPNNYLNCGEVINSLPLREMTSIEEISETIVFLARSKTITGHTLVVDGGLTL